MFLPDKMGKMLGQIICFQLLLQVFSADTRKNVQKQDEGFRVYFYSLNQYSSIV